MSARRDLLDERSRQWLRFAQDDLNIAREVLRMDQPSARIAAFHAQQAAEKALKAYLVFRDTAFPFTHDLAVLMELCREHRDWGAALDGAERSSKYGAQARYPGMEPEVTMDEAQRAVDVATSVVDAARSALKDEGLEL